MQLFTSADNVTLHAFAAEHQPCSSQSISPGHWTHISRPTTVAVEGWDRQPDARQFHRPCCAYYATVSVIVVVLLCKVYGVVWQGVLVPAEACQHLHHAANHDAVMWHS